MSGRVKGIIEKYLQVDIVGYDDNASEEYVLMLGHTERHEKDVLDETLDIMKRIVCDCVEEECFHQCKRVLDDVEYLVGFMNDNWRA